MRFNASLPDDRVNVSDRSAAREALLLVAGVVALAISLVVVLAVAIELVIPFVPVGVERYASSAWSVLDAEDDPRAADAKAIVDRLVAHWPDNELDYRIGILDSDQPNALALPGGAILLTTALLDGITNENELAFVLGHELGHFRNRDHLRGIGRGLTFAITLGLLGIGDGLAGNLSATAGTLAQRSFGREQEHDADRFGLELIGREYGHAGGSIEVFTRLLVEPEVEAETNATQRYFQSHPSNPERIDALRLQAREQGLDFLDQRQVWPHEATSGVGT
ncbi:MAG: M48 family metalloprotease [bacterium]|nr:M48 family metalloprotease [bacterium]